MKLSKKARTRIGKVIEIMESLPRSANKHFRMASWFVHDGPIGEHGLEQNMLVERAHLHACGTSACAMGWAATTPYFRRLGVQLVMDAAHCARLEVNGASGLRAWTELAKVFDVPPQSLLLGELFGSDNQDPTPKAWARRARRVLRMASRKQ